MSTLRPSPDAFPVGPDALTAGSKSFQELAPKRASFQQRLLQNLFLLSLFLYPFWDFGMGTHFLYIVPQLLMLIIASRRVFDALFSPEEPGFRFAIAFLALIAVSLAVLVEATSAEPEYLEAIKLTLNCATLFGFLFLPDWLDFQKMTRWLTRFIIIWLTVILLAYARAGTTLQDLALLFFSDSSGGSSTLYAFATPLDKVLLTKNISAMYFVAVYGAFLYSSTRCGVKVRIWQHALFLVAIFSLVSRQAMLSYIVMLALSRMMSASSRKRIVIEFSIAAGIGVFLFLALFDLNSPGDGANARTILWGHFFDHFDSFIFLGQGIHSLNKSLEPWPYNIDNYHMFFMNQIGSYGIVHCLAFNAILLVVTVKSRFGRYKWLLLMPYWLNVTFQTYGYEFGNLFLFMIAATTTKELVSAKTLERVVVTNQIAGKHIISLDQ